MSRCFCFHYPGLLAPRVSKGSQYDQALPDCRASGISERLEMIQPQKSLWQEWLLALALLGFALAAPTSSFAEKIKPEEIVARHLDSIGPAKARASARV